MGKSEKAHGELVGMDSAEHEIARVTLELDAVTKEKDALAAALASLLSAVAKYMEWNGRSCEYDEDEPDPECPTCQIDEELNRAFGEAMGCDNMNWDEVREFAVEVPMKVKPPVDFQEGWVNGGKRIVGKI